MVGDDRNRRNGEGGGMSRRILETRRERERDGTGGRKEIANCKGESFLVERCNNFSDIRPKSNKTRFSSVCTRNRRYNMSVPKIKIERSNSLRSLSHASYHLISAFREVSDLSLKVAGTMCNNRVYTEPSLRLFELG
ncbi:uncharacterized protein LOC143212383 isoform X1 [Lasioglossum baleicum]|uniref:uncharacterized protein LOC143212383 isoform X1 n=1 Tax=Lasioglossum baleicum TaxID=434251 RepID=UPI003FCCE561